MRELETRLEQGLARPLPGPAAQMHMAPRPRRGWRPGEWPDDSRHGGGLLLVYPRHGRPHVLLTLRDPNLPQHAGQVSLPGGAARPGESWADAALREAREEVGIDGAGLRLLGALSPIHVPVSGFVIHPWIGLSREATSFRPDPREVARILEVPLDDLRDPARRRVERRAREGRLVSVPYFDLEGQRVWGATAMILAEFLFLLGAPPAAD